MAPLKITRILLILLEVGQGGDGPCPAHPAILILLAVAVIIPGRQKLLHGRKRKIRRL